MPVYFLVKICLLNSAAVLIILYPGRYKFSSVSMFYTLSGAVFQISLHLYPIRYIDRMHQEHHITNFVKYQRNKQKLTQEQLAERAGVGLRFIRELEQGKETLRMDKVNQVLRLFGHALSAKPAKVLDPYA